MKNLKEREFDKKELHFATLEKEIEKYLNCSFNECIYKEQLSNNELMKRFKVKTIKGNLTVDIFEKNYVEIYNDEETVNEAFEIKLNK